MLMFEVLKKYSILDVVDTVDKYGRGTVNRTYIVNAKKSRFALQMIDFNVFKDINKVIENIDNVINFIKTTKNPFPLEILKSDEGQKFVNVNETIWRCYKLKQNEKIIKKIANDIMPFEIGKLIGNFHNIAKNYPVSNLHITLPNYHDTYKYSQKLSKVNAKDKSGKSLYLFNQIKFIEDRKESLKLITNLLKTKKVPLRVTHNNLRLNNMFFDCKTYKGIELIGYDAVMPGTLLYDFGDAARYFCSTTREDESVLSLVTINLDYFKSFVKGYYEEVKEFITKTEEEHLVDSVKIMALEYGIRHLIDYLENNKHFTVDYQEQNWDIAKNQFKLVEEIEAHFEEMKKIVNEVINEFLVKE